MKKILLGLLVLMTTIVSCTDNEDIEIAYQTRISITASHIFDNYRTVLGDDFKMRGTENGNWNLNLHAFIYDSNGEIVKEMEQQYSYLDGILDFNLDLLPGKYSVIAIAEFTGTYDGSYYKFWNISNKNHLRDLYITESETLLGSPFETLGITSKEFEIGNKSQDISIDIKPVTGLLQIIIWDNDFSNKGIDGYSSYAQYVENLSIYAPDLKKVVKFNGTTTPTYDYGDQATRYQIALHSPKTQFENRGSKQILSYRALLPQDNRDFYWELNCVKGTGYNLFPDGSDWKQSELTDKLNIRSGNQYVMDLLLDGLYLFVQDYDPNVDMFERAQGYINSLNEQAFIQIMDRNFETFIGASLSTIKNTFGENGMMYNGTLYYFSYNQYVSTLAFGIDSETNKAKNISILFQNLNDDFRQRMTQYLTNRFTVFEKGTDAHTKAFIDGSSLENSNIGIIWNLDSDMLTYTQLR